MRHVGTQNIETPRLLLRRLAPADAPAMYRNWACDPAVTRYLRWEPHKNVDETFAGNYASMFVTGASVAYGKIGVGIEARLGSCTYKTFSGDLDFSASKIKTSGFRAFIQFRW